MIRFLCTKCGREYVVSNALARLPLLCKGCGDRIIVPDPSESLPEPPPEEEKPDSLVSPTVDDSLFMSIEGSGPAPPPQPMPPLPEPAPIPPPRRSVNTKLVDGATLFVALCLGAFIGEYIAKKSTLQILGDAPASAKFPPTDLAIWVGTVATFGLFYLWLITRGWSLGARLRR